MANEETPEQPKKVEKSPKKIVGILVISVLVVGAAVTGTLLGPKLLHAGPPNAEAAPPAEVSKAEKEPGETEPTNPQAFAPLVVDVKNKHGEMHHMRVGFTVELGEKVTKEEFERFQPRGRETAIAFLRSKSFEELTDASEFENITKQLNDKVIRAMGEKRVSRVVVTDYVAQ